MKTKVETIAETLRCWCSAKEVIDQLQYYIDKYGEENVSISYDFPPYDDTMKHLIIVSREETDEEYEKRKAHEAWKAKQQREKELQLFGELKAKYETLKECAKDE